MPYKTYKNRYAQPNKLKKDILISRKKLAFVFLPIAIVLIVFLKYYPLEQIENKNTLRIIAGVIIFILLFGAYIAFKVSQYTEHLAVNQESIQIGESNYYWSDISSYKTFNTLYFDTLTIRFNSGKSIHLTGLDNEKKSAHYFKFKSKFLEHINKMNNNSDSPILEKSFYKTKAGKIFGVLILILNVLAIYMLLTEQMRIFPVLILASSSIPIISAIKNK